MAKRILIVDDEPNIVISLEWLMKSEGFETLAVGDGEGALAAVAQNAPDLVVLDVMLPSMNGFEVCRRIRSDPRGGSTAFPVHLLVETLAYDAPFPEVFGNGACEVQRTAAQITNFPGGAGQKPLCVFFCLRR